MSTNWTRRSILGAAGAALAGSVAQQVTAQEAAKTVKVVGIACSPRKDKNTVAALRAALDAAKESSPRIEIELIDLGGMSIPGDVAAGIALKAGQEDDFPKVEARMREPNVGGIIVATPVYFSGMSSLCKSFLDRWMVFRKTFDLRDKVGGAIAVGAARNGGQELTLQSVHAAMFCQDMVLVSDGKPTARLGGILVSSGDDVTQDVTGMATAKGVGRRVAEIALRLAATAK